MRNGPHAPHIYRGAALLTAMLTVALVAALASATLWQQWRSVEVESAERSRLQSQWVLTGALDWARLILREDARSGSADHLAEPWAVPLEEARLSTFLASDKNSTADSDDTVAQAFLSGRIVDLQSRMNVLNLVSAGTVFAPAQRAFARLFEVLDLPESELDALIENLRFAMDTSPDNGSAARAALMPQRLDELVWLGLSRQTLDILRPHITLLPARAAVNLNTASATVLYASIPTLSMAQARQLVTARSTSHFRTLADAARVIGEAATNLNETQHATSTHFFEVHGRLRQDDRVVDEVSVLQRDGLEVKTLWRDRGAARPPQPGSLQ